MDAKYRVVEWKLQWRFWSPKDCIGGPIRFGSWAICEGEGRLVEMTAFQVSVKQKMGLIQ